MSNDMKKEEVPVTWDDLLPVVAIIVIFMAGIAYIVHGCSRSVGETTEEAASASASATNLIEEVK